MVQKLIFLVSWFSCNLLSSSSFITAGRRTFQEEVPNKSYCEFILRRFPVYQVKFHSQVVLRHFIFYFIKFVLPPHYDRRCLTQKRWKNDVTIKKCPSACLHGYDLSLFRFLISVKAYADKKLLKSGTWSWQLKRNSRYGCPCKITFY